MELLTVSAGNSTITSSHDQKLEPCSPHSHFILTMFALQHFIELHTKMNSTYQSYYITDNKPNNANQF